MKKFIIVAALVLAFAGIAVAEMDQATISATAVTTNVATGTGIVKGEIYSIRLDSTAAKTQAVTIVTAEGETILSVSALTADATYYPMIGANKASDGTAITSVGAATDTGTNTVYQRIGVSSDLTMTVTPAASTTGSNILKAIITYFK